MLGIANGLARATAGLVSAGDDTGVEISSGGLGDREVTHITGSDAVSLPVVIGTLVVLWL